MKSEFRGEILAKKISEMLSKGIGLSADVVHYIDSTFSNPTIEELQIILADDSNCEKDSLMELLFFPDESMQVELEELLERYKPQNEDEKKKFKESIPQLIELNSLLTKTKKSAMWIVMVLMAWALQDVAEWVWETLKALYNWIEMLKHTG